MVILLNTPSVKKERWTLLRKSQYFVFCFFFEAGLCLSSSIHLAYFLCQNTRWRGVTESDYGSRYEFCTSSWHIVLSISVILLIALVWLNFIGALDLSSCKNMCMKILSYILYWTDINNIFLQQRFLFTIQITTRCFYLLWEKIYLF